MAQERVLFAGDLVFRSRVPYAGQADSRHWIDALEWLLTLDMTVIVPGHGPPSRQPKADLQLTREYLLYLRQSLRQAANKLEPFDDAYQNTDWSRFEHSPLFREANRVNCLQHLSATGAGVRKINRHAQAGCFICFICFITSSSAGLWLGAGHVLGCTRRHLATGT